MVHTIYHQMMKFLTPHMIGVVKGKLTVAGSCYVQSVRRHVVKNKEKETMSIQTDEDYREERSHPTPAKAYRRSS